ncbi:37S ribosomal protein S11 [Pyronema domesticum]|nr:37S ribosomal protein S11 [Pyronema domesticum]
MSVAAFRRTFASVLTRTTPLQTASTPLRRWASDSSKPPAKPSGSMMDIASLLESSSAARPPRSSVLPIDNENASAMIGARTEFDPSSEIALDPFGLTAPTKQDEYHHLHIYSTKHNTHITFTKPDKGAIISMSAGNLGFKKSQRGTYDAAYQLASFVFKGIEEKKVQPRAIEVVLRGFGQGREAVVKALMGQEGKYLKPVVKRVTDSTRLKFGGTRSKKPRRLG